MGTKRTAPDDDAARDTTLLAAAGGGDLPLNVVTLLRTYVRATAIIESLRKREIDVEGS